MLNDPLPLIPRQESFPSAATPFPNERHPLQSSISLYTLTRLLSSTRRRAHSSFAHRGTAPGVDVAARRKVAVAITDRSTETVQASSQSGQA